ncbi:MAG TPA: tetratricopeptide repeat protein [Leptolyngbyaceae cyanobacterium M65_K2018_010]|nr:tetratricopeptide repeat protein [Leptolyngbyaceae cyanobacterium M65_K2018_010]
MGQSISVNQADFETQVLVESFERPVLVDFFATWCGPCQLLKPMLEKLAQEYDITVAKVDIDQNPELARTFGVEGVPDVRIVSQGQVQEGFVGVLPEPQIRELLAQLGLESTLEQALAQFQVVQAGGDPTAIANALKDLLIQYPENPQVLIRAARWYLSQGQGDLARQYLDLIPASDRQFLQPVEGLRELLALQATLAEPATDSPLETAYRQGCQAALAGDYATALETFLTLVQKDRRFRNDGARKAMLTVFKLLGDGEELTATYRRKLMQSLY